MQTPVVQAQMLIRRPIQEVFEAFVDPSVTTRFWFTRSTGRLVEGGQVEWHWDMYGVSAPVQVKVLEPHHRIVIDWGTTVEWVFSPYRGDQGTLVRITNSGFEGDDDGKVAQAIDSKGGFSMLLAGAKAWLEHGIELNLVADHHPPD